MELRANERSRIRAVEVHEQVMSQGVKRGASHGQIECYVDGAVCFDGAGR